MASELTPEFEQQLDVLLRQRNRWRWTLSGLLIGAYLIYAFIGLNYAEVYGQGFAGTHIPVGIVFGLLLIVSSIAASLVYIRVAAKSVDAYNELRNASAVRA